MGEYEVFFDDLWSDCGGYHVVLSRDGNRTDLIEALIVKTSLSLVGQFSAQLLSKVKDITVKAKDLIVNGSKIFPTRGDLIYYSDGVNDYTYEVFADVAPTYADVDHELIKIHAHEIAVTSDSAVYNELGEPIHNEGGEELYNEFGERN